ncbi:MAG: hypothetical protein IPN13_12080 [Bacteroidetes bacterium]|nr:hypothetical protein [Bacteroidota bacterium]
MLAFLVGIYGYTVSIAGEHIYFFVPAPIAAFIVSGLMWKWTFKQKDDYKVGNVISMGLIGVPIIHYLTFVLMGLGRFICYYLTGKCTDYSGKHESIIFVMSISIIQSLISIYKIGILTVPSGILIGLFTMRKSKLRQTAVDNLPPV